jgi:hypothetical protein
MSVNVERQTFAPVVRIDGYTRHDVCQLLAAVEAFARFGPVEAVVELTEFVDGHLSPNGLAKLADALARRLVDFDKRPPR